MKWTSIILATLALSLPSASALAAGEELQQAYEKEYAYLVAERKALTTRLQQLDASQKKTIDKVRAEIDQLQKNYLQIQNVTDRLNQQIVEANRGVDVASNDELLLETTLIQAGETLKKSGFQITEEDSSEKQLEEALQSAKQRISEDSKLAQSQQEFFLPSGESVEGSILQVGRIARFALGNEVGGILAPAGNGLFKVWQELPSTQVQQMMQGQFPQSLSIFLYDNAEQAIEQQEEKGFEDELEAGGVIGWVIMVLGLIGLLLVILRIAFLIAFGSNIQSISAKVEKNMEKGKVDSALKYCKKNISSASRVIAATLRNLDKDRDHIEDIISESILHESARIDRFGTAILVIAAISPLLGLLGTVTGMISTFDIITEFGTGDPKLLSSGISEALITTKFGLIVAIPLLLLGNLLSGWGSRIKNDLEQAALHMINSHKAA